MADLAIRISADAGDAVRAAGQVGDAYTSMGSEIERASLASEAAASRIDGVAASADDLGGKAGRATGALGALASGAELAGPGFEKYGTALQSAALATDFASGVGDTLNLVMESTILKNARARATTIAKAVAERGAAAATRAMAAGQWALNAAMTANPIGLVVAAIALLVAGFVLAFKKSDAFRGIIQTVGQVGRDAIGWIIDKLGDLVKWVRDKVPPAFDTMKDKLDGVLDVLLTPLETILGLVEDIVGAIKKIDLPDLPGWLPGAGRSSSSGRVTFPAGSGPATVTAASPTTTIHLTVNGAVDPMSAGRQLVTLLSDYLRANGSTQIVIA